MIVIKKIVTPIAILVTLVVSLTMAQAADRGNGVGSLKSFQSGGIINSVNSTELVANGKQFRFNTPLLFLESSLKKSVSGLAVDDHVWLKGKILNDVFYIDTISVLPSDEDS